MTISDKKKGVADPLNAALIKFFEPYMLSGTDYYPFGMAMRVGGESKYKYGFNGQEMSNEIKGGEGNSYTAEFWEYDPRIGRRWNVDPIYKHSPYETYAGNPILFSDPAGLDTINFSRHTTRFIPKGDNVQGWERSTFSIDHKQAEGNDVYLFSSSITTLENGQVSTVINKPFILSPENPGSKNGITKGKNLYFDGLITTERNNYDWETVGKFMWLDENFSAYLIARNSKTKGWKEMANGVAIMEGLLPVLVQSGLGLWGGYRYSGMLTTSSTPAATQAAPATFETSSFIPTHAIKKTRTQMQTLLDDVRANGVKNDIKFVEFNGKKYIVDGHHRYYSAQKLGIDKIPAQQVQLPYGSYKTTYDLMFEGKMPGFWKHLK